MKMASLGPFKDLGEDEMEPYSRLFSALAILGNHKGTQRRKDVLFSNAPFLSKPISEKDVPLWMTPEISNPAADNTERVEDQLRLKPKKFKVFWQSSKNSDDAGNYIANNSLDLSIENFQISVADPRTMVADEYRDQVKHQFKLLTLGAPKVKFQKQRSQFLKLWRGPGRPRTQEGRSPRPSFHRVNTTSSHSFIKVLLSSRICCQENQTYDDTFHVARSSTVTPPRDADRL